MSVIMFDMEQLVGKQLMMNMNEFEVVQDLFHGDNLDDEYMINPHENSIINFDVDYMNGAEYMLDSNDLVMNNNNSDHPNNWLFSTLMKQVENEEEEEEEEAIMTTTTKKLPKALDRSRTLISEQRRRGRMKEKLYSLRSLVPNITKMDKASIVGDAVLYVKQLQMQAKKLKADISVLESSINQETQSNHHPHSNQSIPSKIIIQLDVFQVEEKGFYLRLVCKMGERVAMSLYKVLESLTTFNIQSSNLASASDTFILTATINVTNCTMDMDLPNLKLWLTKALLNHGFEF